jgi:chromosome partitioning protein
LPPIKGKIPTHPAAPEDPVAKTIAFFNQSGGVAKTSLTMNLGYQLAQHGQRVLLIDLDPQASLTVFMGLEPQDIDQLVADRFFDEDAALLIHRDIHGMDLIPTNINLSAVEQQLSSVMAREIRLKQALADEQDNYDFILIDCPPSLSILSTLALTAATHVLVPVQTHFKAFKGVELLLDTIHSVKKFVNPTLAIAGFVPTLYSNASQDRQVLEALQEQVSALATVFPPIPRATAFADASMSLQPLAVYSPRHPAVQILDTIAHSLESL